MRTNGVISYVPVLFLSHLAQALVYNVPETEIAALQDLYDATNGNSWNWDEAGTGSKWNFTDPNPCADAWQGVNCSQIVSDGFVHVVALDLYAYGLAGSIPASIAQLPQLATLRLSFNELNGTVPESVGQLTVLTELYLDVNLLTGTVPASLGQLVQLTTLDLDTNLLSGAIPGSFQQLTQLTQLYLDYNRFSGTVPAFLGQHALLAALNLDTNFLSGTIPPSLCQLTGLTVLGLDDNQLSGTIPDALDQLTQLPGLYLGGNQLTGTIPTTLFQLVQLTTLDLDDNRLSGPVPDALQQLTQLTLLYLDGNQLTGTIPDALSTLGLLELLALDHNLLSGTIPDSLQQLTQLTELFLEANQLTGTIPPSLGQLTQLTILDADANLLLGTIPHALKQLTQLTQLYLDTNLLTGTIPPGLGQLTQLTVLSMDGNKLRGTIPSSMQQLTQLTLWYLGHNLLTGTIPAALGELTQLNLLDLDWNHLSGTIPDSLQRLIQLTQLYLGDNRLTGAIPASLGQLVQLTALDLDTNLLSGPIPDSLQQLTQLSLLQLEHNKLTGTVPGSLVALVELRLLQLGFNRLTGPLPVELVQLAMLEVLYVQDNQLTGTIPTSPGQLAGIKAVSLGSNQLHGIIPPDWAAAADAIAVLHLDDNHLSGSIPVSLGQIPLLISLNLSSNYLTGTIPASFQQLSSLRVLMLQNNRLRGNLTELFSLTQQRNLSTVQLSGNRLTGTLPAAAFLLPSLSSFAAVENCFDGPLPEEAICSSASLSALVLDGLHSAPSCRNSASLSHKAFKLGPLPQCLLHMPNLATLHLSGSGLTGSLPAEANISAVLTDLALSHNLVTGAVAGSILNRDWAKLDLSYNRLTGTLHSGGVVPYGNATALYLQHNRLSGAIPGSMQRVNSLSLLENNMFSCRADRNDVPQHDNDSDKYTCGSDAVSNALYAWIGAVVAVAVASAVAVHRGHGIQMSTHFRAGAHDGKLGKLQDLFRAAHKLCVLGAGSAAYCILVLLPVYAAVDSYYPSFTYKYAWTVSGVFLSGTAAFALEAVFLLLQLPVCAYVAERLLSRNAPVSQVDAVGAPAGPTTASAPLTATFMAVMLFSLAVVMGINVAFVIATLNINGRELTIIQILLAVFKLGFNNVVAPALHNRVRAVGVGHEITTSQLLLVLLNVIVIPCLVVMIISPACFYDALAGSDPVTSSYDYGGGCHSFEFVFNAGASNVLQVNCKGAQTQLGITTYTPPFTYSYQCSSSFVTSYAPTFVIMCIISGFVVPAYHLLLLWLRRNLSPTSRLYSTVTAVTPRILRELRSAQDFAQARSDPLYRPVFDAKKPIMSLLTYLALLLTFGALFPPLAVCCAVAMASVVLTARLQVGRYVSAAVAADRHDCLDEVESACAGVATPVRLRTALYLVLAVSCLFYTLFLFDTLGYEVGFAGAFWVLIVVPLLPVVAWALRAVAVRILLRGPAALENGEASFIAQDPEVGVELATKQQTASGAVAGAETGSENPMHKP
jgi:Leucine-rich repeat (LRR) protein